MGAGSRGRYECIFDLRAAESGVGSKLHQLIILIYFIARPMAGHRAARGARRRTVLLALASLPPSAASRSVLKMDHVLLDILAVASRHAVRPIRSRTEPFRGRTQCAEMSS